MVGVGVEGWGGGGGGGKWRDKFGLEAGLEVVSGDLKHYSLKLFRVDQTEICCLHGSRY